MTGPFAWGEDPDPLDPQDGLGRLVRSRVTQCALSRICGVCAEPLGRPITFVATPDEIARNALHAPPLHEECARDLLRHPGADPTWRTVATAGFEFVRAAREDLDHRPIFAPNSLLDVVGGHADASPTLEG